MRELDARLQTVLYHLVELYLETKAPVGSVALSRSLDIKCSPATVRYMMSELESRDLITSLHTSSGRVPTEQGMRLMMPYFCQPSSLDAFDRDVLEESARAFHRSPYAICEDITLTLSQLSSCAGIAHAPDREDIFEHVDLIILGSGQILVIFVMQDGRIEKQTLSWDGGIESVHVDRARQYLQRHLKGKTLGQGMRFAHRQTWCQEGGLDLEARLLIEACLAFDHWHEDRAFIVKGQDMLLKTWFVSGNPEMAGDLWHTLDAKETLFALFDLVRHTGRVQIFMGSSNAYIRSHNFAAVMAPYTDASGDDQGVVGVLGPTAMDYRRIVPMVNYTACLLGRIVG